MSVWNPDNIKDVAESVGISSLSDEVLQALSSDVEFRLSQVLEEAFKFMRHSKRTTLWTQDIAQALRVLDVEPLYGYESTRPLRFGEASIGPGQPLFYVEDEEVDFEKLINAPLPKVPREISFTAHWLAVEGVQPSIPQNPTSADARNLELLPKGPGANPHLAAINGNDNIAVKPLVKHILSKELQLYFEKICSALLDENNDEYRIAAFASLRSDPGLHQLVPYFAQFIAEKVTHSLKNMFILEQMMQFAAAILDNESLYIEPYVSALIPPILTCLVSAHLGPTPSSRPAYGLRDVAASLLGLIAKKYSKSSHTLKPRLARTCLRNFLAPLKPFYVHYGAILGLQAVGGREVVRTLILPNLKEYGKLLQEAIEQDLPSKVDAETVIAVITKALESLDDGGVLVNGYASGDEEALRQKLHDKLGELIGQRVYDLGRPHLVQAVLEA
ncbi:MAG: hypothetical protein MMC33_004534 [Icmadophila ericetorum]|nr:hypothetical protein [Icmadophila ericetorum]